jgi:hypothetical protein
MDRPGHADPNVLEIGVVGIEQIVEFFRPMAIAASSASSCKAGSIEVGDFRRGPLSANWLNPTSPQSAGVSC